MRRDFDKVQEGRQYRSGERYQSLERRFGGVGVPHQAGFEGGDQEDDHGRLREGKFYGAAEQTIAAKDDDSAAEAALAMFKSKNPKT